MRGEELQRLLVARFEALTVDDKATAGDHFRHDAGESDDGNVKPDRVFELIQGQLKPNFTFEARTLTSVFRFRAYYADGPRLAKRLISDGERVLSSIQAISNVNMHDDVFGPAEVGDWVPAEDQVPGQIVAEVDFAITYNLTGF